MTFWYKILKSFVALSGSKAGNGQFFKHIPKSMRDCYMQTMKPCMNIFNKYFKNVKSCNFSGVGGYNELYELLSVNLKRLTVSHFNFFNVQSCCIKAMIQSYDQTREKILANKTEVL